MARLALLFLTLSLLIPGSLQARGPLVPVKLNGKHYVTLESIRDFYGFTQFQKQGGRLLLSNAKIQFKMRPGSQQVLMNNVKFIFSEPLRASSQGYLVSRIDVEKLIDPVMRPAYISEARPFDTVIIDPGHGGKDPGATNAYGTEAEYNLKVAKLLSTYLRKAGFKVVMTRQDNRYLTLQQRVKIANAHRNAIFLSIHFNAANNRANGMETFTLSPVGVAHYGRSLRNSDYEKEQGNHQDAANIALATALHWGALSGLKNKAIGMFDRGIRRARYSVLTGIKHPAILIEGGFLSNPRDARIIHSKKYQETYAQSLAKAILIYRKATTRRAISKK